MWSTCTTRSPLGPPSSSPSESYLAATRRGCVPAPPRRRSSATGSTAGVRGDASVLPPFSSPEESANARTTTTSAATVPKRSHVVRPVSARSRRGAPVCRNGAVAGACDSRTSRPRLRGRRWSGGAARWAARASRQRARERARRPTGPVIGLAGQAVHDGRLELGRHVGAQLADRRDGLLALFDDELGKRLEDVRRTGRQELEQHATERVDVGRCRDGLPGRLLRREVCRVPSTLPICVSLSPAPRARSRSRRS